MLRRFNRIKDVLIPPLCPCCGSIVIQDHTICHTCWAQASFIEEPLCNICGIPFEFSSDDTLICAPCAKTVPPYDLGRSILVYDTFSKRLILPFKHGDAMHLGALMAKWSVQRQPSLFNNIDYIIPVPLHWRRLIKRQYNQAAILSGYLSKLTNIKHEPMFLIRKRYTDSQGGKSLKERQDNVSTAFRLAHHTALKGKSVLLVDDVFTTGATVEACCKELRKGGIKRLHVLTFARVLKPQTVR